MVRGPGGVRGVRRATPATARGSVARGPVERSSVIRAAASG
jgi:hypothetical protein